MLHGAKRRLYKDELHKEAIKGEHQWEMYSMICRTLYTSCYIHAQQDFRFRTC